MRPRAGYGLVTLAFALLSGPVRAGDVEAPRPRLAQLTPPAQRAGSPEGVAPVETPAGPPPPTIPSVAPPSFGPFGPPYTRRVGLEIHPWITISEEYTDNFRLSSRDEEENFRTSVGVGFGLSISGARTRGQIDLGLTASHDTATDDFDVGQTASLTGQLGYEFNPRLRVTVTDVLTHSDIPGVSDALSLRRERSEFTSNTFMLDVDYLIANLPTREYYRLTNFFDHEGPDTVTHAAGVSASTRFMGSNSAGLGYEFVRSDTSGRGADITGHQGSAWVARQLNPRTVVGLAGSYAFRTVTETALVPADPADPTATGAEGELDTSYRLGSVSLFTGYSSPGPWSVSTSVGYAWIVPESRADESAITSVTTLTYRFARAVATLSGSVGFSETFLHGENFGVVETRGVEGSLWYPFTPFVAGIGRLFYRQNEFTDVVVTEANRSEIGRTEDSWGGVLSLTVQLARWLTLVLEYGYTNASSSTPDRDYVENRGRAALTATF